MPLPTAEAPTSRFRLTGPRFVANRQLGVRPLSHDPNAPLRSGLLAEEAPVACHDLAVGAGRLDLALETAPGTGPQRRSAWEESVCTRIGLVVFTTSTASRHRGHMTSNRG